MDQNQRPHSREKTTSSGSAGVNKGRKVSGGPVGSGGRGSSGGSGNRPSSGGQRGFFPAGGSSSGSSGGTGGGLPKLNLKTILILAAVVIIGLFLLRNCGGSLPEIPDLPDEPSSPSFPSSPSYSDITFPTANSTQADDSVSPQARAKRVTPLGGGRDVVTVMVYMCGTDLESKYGMATSDLQEMLNAEISDKVNLIVLTGGCSKWKNTVISSSVNQIYKVENGGLRKLEDNFGTAAMTDPQNLTDFIDYCEAHYPADRNMLIFWDHGGGTLSGYGYDEKHPNSSSMTLAKIDDALKAANCTFDFIGFDACLMATLETALVCNSYADYLLASEETEPGTGWHYTGWLTQLSKNTSVPTVELSKTIIDDFVSASCSASSGAQVTLSVMDLAELDGTVPAALRSFATSTNRLLQSDSYQQVSDARAGVRQFAQSSKINQVDLVDLALRIDTAESRALAETLQSCVKYNRSTISRSYGVSIFFPYENTKNVKNAVASYQDLGIDSEYTKCIQSFASLEYGGQITASATQSTASAQGGSVTLPGGDLLGSLLSAYAGSGSSTSPLGMLMGSFGGGSASASGLSIDPSTILGLLGGFSGRSMPQEYDWVDTELIADQADTIASTFLNPADLKATLLDGHNVLRLTEEQWKRIQTVELNVFVNDGEGFIDLGLDNTFDWTDAGDLLLEWDGTWLTLNGNACAYYLVSDTQQDDGSWRTVGRIPALLNGEYVNLQVVFDTQHPDGFVTGAYPLYEDVSVQAKGEIAVNAGDTIELLCDYYEPDGTYSASYTLGDAFTVPQSGLTLRNMKMDVKDVSVTYRLTDLYGNHFWTPAFAQ